MKTCFKTVLVISLLLFITQQTLAQDSSNVHLLSSIWQTAPHNITIQGNYAYIADRYGGLVSYDISNPLSPVLIGTCRHPVTVNDRVVWNIAASGNRVYVAETMNGLTTFDITDHQHPINCSDNFQLHHRC